MELIRKDDVYKMLDDLTDQELDTDCSVGWNAAITEACRRIKDIPVEGEMDEPDTCRSWKLRIVNITLMIIFVAIALSILILGVFEGSIFMTLLAAGALTWAIYEVVNGDME